MADLTTLAPPSFCNVPGLADTKVRVYRVALITAADTLKVPFLRTQSGTADQSSARVLQPATGVTVTVGALDSNNEHTITFGGSGAVEGVVVTLVTLHPNGRS